MFTANQRCWVSFNAARFFETRACAHEHIRREMIVRRQQLLIKRTEVERLAREPVERFADQNLSVLGLALLMQHLCYCRALERTLLVVFRVIGDAVEIDWAGMDADGDRGIEPLRCVL